MLNNKIFSEKLNIPISKVRRNTKEFLGEDPIAKRRTGFRREFSVNDGYFVYLGGLLVSHLGFSFHEARRIIDDLKPWLLKIGYVPDIPGKIQIDGVEKERTMLDAELNIYSVPDSGEFRYLIRDVQPGKVEKKLDRTGKEYNIGDLKYLEFWLTETYFPLEFHRTMYLGMDTSQYIVLIKGEKQHAEWINRQIDLRYYSD
jgi:hypothetical protein